MEKIEKNMYVRTKEGDIGKVTRIFDIAIITDIDKGENIIAGTIKKASYNIFDLIEEGDYINGGLVDYSLVDKNGKNWIHISDYDGAVICTEDNFDIETIVTKEQFKNMEYKI